MFQQEEKSRISKLEVIKILDKISQSRAILLNRQVVLFQFIVKLSFDKHLSMDSAPFVVNCLQEFQERNCCKCQLSQLDQQCFPEVSKGQQTFQYCKLLTHELIKPHINSLRPYGICLNLGIMHIISFLFNGNQQPLFKQVPVYRIPC